MNSQILLKYGMSFLKKANGEKLISNTSTSYIASYISEFDAETANEFIEDINLCLNGQYSLIEDSTRSTELIYAKLYVEGLYFDDNVPLLPLIDLKELLLSWKGFLEKD
jgi:hypothetical protein